MTTFRILQAIEDRSGLSRYWVFACRDRHTHMVASNVTLRRAVTSVFDQVTDEDIVESVQTSGLLREEFGSEFRARLAPYLIPHE